MVDERVRSLEERLGYRFRDSALLKQALTHPSVFSEAQRGGLDNQRLEFLGDAVLQMVLTEHLFRTCPDSSEGDLTKIRAALVNRQTLGKQAETLGLGDALFLGRGEEKNGGRIRQSNLADAFEAVVGAIYLDGGLKAAQRLILEQCHVEIDQIQSSLREINPKGDLQELIQAVSQEGPVYSIVSAEGPQHGKVFEVTVSWRGRILGRGRGPSKQAAEIHAAREALNVLNAEGMGGPAKGNP